MHQGREGGLQENIPPLAGSPRGRMQRWDERHAGELHVGGQDAGYGLSIELRSGPSLQQAKGVVLRLEMVRVEVVAGCFPLKGLAAL